VQESLDAIGEALAENGKVIVTGCLGKREQEIRDDASFQGAQGNRPTSLRRSDERTFTSTCRPSTILFWIWCRPKAFV
jgi:hypothetical protein